MPERDDLDRLLDAALLTYAEPGPALATNVLAQVSARRAIERRVLWLWGTGLASAAAAAVLLAVIAPLHTPMAPHTAPRIQTPIPPTSALAERPAIAIPTHRTVPHTHPMMAHTITASAPLPKQEIFPAPSPLSDQEQALVRLISALPTTQQEHLMQTQKQPVEPLHIAAISIPPLEPTSQNER